MSDCGYWTPAFAPVKELPPPLIPASERVKKLALRSGCDSLSLQREVIR
jgi:hypothetical protein